MTQQKPFKLREGSIINMTPSDQKWSLDDSSLRCLTQIFRGSNKFYKLDFGGSFGMLPSDPTGSLDDFFSGLLALRKRGS